MILAEHQLQDMGGESASNATTDLRTHFGCVVPDQIAIHLPTMSTSKGRAKRMKTGVERVVDWQSYMWMCHYFN